MSRPPPPFGRRAEVVRAMERERERGDPDLPEAVGIALAYRRAFATRRRWAPIAAALSVADEARFALDGIEQRILGSTGRALSMVGDVDLAVCIRTPEDRDRVRAVRGTLTKGGPALDVRASCPESWGALCVILGGPAEFSEALKVVARDAGLELHANSLRRNGERVPCPDEASLFRALGLPFIAPAERSQWRHWVAHLRRLRQHAILTPLPNDR